MVKRVVHALLNIKTPAGIAGVLFAECADTSYCFDIPNLVRNDVLIGLCCWRLGPGVSRGVSRARRRTTRL